MKNKKKVEGMQQTLPLKKIIEEYSITFDAGLYFRGPAS